MFQGFDEETVAFLWGVRFNNYKSWFEEHKPDYTQHVYEPMKALAAEVYEGLHTRFPEEELFCKVSRIYRDARRLYGRGPYKDHLWFCIRRAGEDWIERPTFWFELAPEGYSYGMGFYAAKAFTMEQFRKEIDTYPERFRPIAEAMAEQTRFVLSGDEYARKKGEPGGILNEWYNRKNFAMEYSSAYDELSFSADLKDRIVEDLAMLMPLYRYFDAFSRRIET